MYDSWMFHLQDIVQTCALERVEHCPSKATRRRSHISFHETKDLLNHYSLAESAELIKLLVLYLKYYWRHRERSVLDSEKT